MSAQTTYNFGTAIGEAGGIIDLAPYEINSFTNEEADGKMVYGVGVVVGTAAGKQVKLPASASTAAKFEGVSVNRRTTQMNIDGSTTVVKGATVGVMRYGRIYVRVADSITPAYGDACYVLNSGDQAGYFTNAASGAIAIKGRFVGTVDAANRIAPVELFNEAN